MCYYAGFCVITLVSALVSACIITSFFFGLKVTFPILIFLGFTLIIAIWSGIVYDNKYRRIEDNEIEDFFRPKHSQIDINSPLFIEKYEWLTSKGYNHEYLALHNAHIFKNGEDQISMSQNIVDMSLEEFIDTQTPK